MLNFAGGSVMHQLLLLAGCSALLVLLSSNTCCHAQPLLPVSTRSYGPTQEVQNELERRMDTGDQTKIMEYALNASNDPKVAELLLAQIWRNIQVRV